MATAKKKTSAKRNVKYAAKSQSGAARQISPGASWVSSSSADWQKGASDWAKQSAKLYQLPFAQGDVDAATKKAADTVKSATENMVKMGSDVMQQMFGQSTVRSASAAQSFNPAAFFQQMTKMPSMPQFDAAALQDKMSSFARESQEQLSKATQGSTRAAAEAADLSRENIQAATDICNVAAAVSKELLAEMTSYLNRQFTQNVELSKQLLTCRTLNDIFDLSTRMTKANLDGFFSQSVKISEMLFQCATDVSEPLNERVSETSDRLAKALHA